MEKKECIERVMPTLLSAYDDDLKRLGDRVGKDRSERTLLSMKQGRKHVESFLKEQMKREDIPLSELTPQMIHDFCAWLSTSRGLKNGTVWLSCQQLKGVVTRAYQRGMLSWNPFSLFHIAKNIRPREYLTESELALLISHQFEQQQLGFARDIFVFAALTGLSFIDIFELRPADVMNIDGTPWIVTRRHKSKIPFQVRLLKTPYAILNRYLRNGNEKVFGQLKYRTLALQVKRVMKEVGITKHITMHCARHSFAVLALNKGVPIESVSRMLGHTNITTTQIYAKITLQKLDADMAALERNLQLP